MPLDTQAWGTKSVGTMTSACWGPSGDILAVWRSWGLAAFINGDRSPEVDKERQLVSMVGASFQAWSVLL